MTNLVQNSIEQKLVNGLSVDYLDVINESSNHNVPANSETHFKVILVAKDFEGLNMVKRHQKIYQLLRHELQNGVHALALHTLTAEEWREKHGEVPDSPLCRGGEK